MSTEQYLRPIGYVDAWPCLG